MAQAPRAIPGDWYPGGGLPANAQVDASAHVGSSFSFRRYRSQQPVGLMVEGSASLYDTANLYVGPAGHVHLGAFALMAGGALFCNSRIEIGPYSLIAWNVVIMDSTIVPLDRAARRTELEAVANRPSRALNAPPTTRPVVIGKNVWISFGACILAGVRIGDHAIVGARSVVLEDVPPNSIVAGNPARVVRTIEAQDSPAPPEPRPNR